MVVDSIRENISALQIVQQIRKTGDNLDTNLERISSGLRINRPSDDVGGFTISRRLEAEFRGLAQASEDVQTGVNLLNVTTGALSDILDQLQAIRTSAQSAANSLSGDTVLRQTLQSEIEDRLAEINAIASTTTFNRQKLLNGSYSTSVDFRKGTRDFGAEVAFGVDSSTLLGSAFLNLSHVQVGSSQIKADTDATFNTGIQLATDIAVTTVQFVNGGAAAAGGDSLTGANFTVNRVTLATNGLIRYSGVLADGSTAFSGSFSIVGGAVVSDLVTAIQSSIDASESYIGIDTAGGTGSLESNVTLNTTTGRLDFSSGLEGDTSQFDIDFTIENASAVEQTQFGIDRASSISNEEVAVGSTGAQIGNSTTAITGSTFNSGDFDIEVLAVQSEQNNVITSDLGFFTNVSLTTAVVSGDQIRNSYIGSISIDTNDTIAINGTDPDGTTFTTEITVINFAGAVPGDGQARTFQDLIDELNNRDRSDTSYGFNLAVATLTASGEIQLIDDVAGTSSTDLTFTVTDIGNSLSEVSNSTVDTVGQRETATVRIDNGTSVDVEAGEVVTLEGGDSFSISGGVPQVTLRFGSNFSIGTDILETVANIYEGSLNGGHTVEFAPGEQVTFISGTSAISPTARGQRITLNFDSIIDITATSSSGGETFYLSSTSSSINFQIGSGSNTQINFSIGNLSTQNLGTSASLTLDNIDVTTVSGANEALDVIDDAIDQVTLISGRLGGLQSRLEDRVSHLNTTSLNLENSYNSIVSADIAEETTNLALNTVLLEAQSAVLTQANTSQTKVFEILYGLD